MGSMSAEEAMLLHRHLHPMLIIITIIFFFVQSDWLQEREAFYDILTVVQKSYFYEERRQFSKSKHYPKNRKSCPKKIPFRFYFELLQ
jgi:hypothetical protein